MRLRLLPFLLTLFVSALAVRADQVRLAELVTLRRNTAATVAAPGMVEFAFAVGASSVPVAEVGLRFRTPSGGYRTLLAGNTSTITAAVGADWQNGDYILEQAWVRDTWGREIDYRADRSATMSNPAYDTLAQVPNAIAAFATTHPLDFATLGFRVTGGADQLLPPRLTSFTRSSADALAVGDTARFAYAFTPGTSRVVTLRVTFWKPFLYGWRTVAVDSPATSGALTLPITDDDAMGTMRLNAIELIDAQQRTTTYNATNSTLSDANYGATDTFVSLPLDLNGTTFSVTSPTVTRTPQLVSFAARQATPFRPGDNAVFDYEIDPGTKRWDYVAFEFRGPFGATYLAQSDSLKGTLSLPITAGWLSGRYTLGRALLGRNGPSEVDGVLQSFEPKFDVAGAITLPPHIAYASPLSTTTFASYVFLYVSTIEPGPTTVQWYRGNSGDTSNPIAGATNGSYAVLPTDSTNYWARVTANGLSEDSATFTVLVIKPPTVLTQPQNQSVPVGGSATFSVEVNPGNDTVTYRWTMPGRSLTGPDYNRATIRIDNITAAEAGNVRCFVSNRAGGTFSASAILTVRISDVPLAITQQPVNAVTTVGASARFTAAAAGNPPVLYQWQFEGRDIPGAVGTYHSIDAVTESMAGTYRLKVVSGTETVYSNPVTLTFAHAPYIQTQPGNIGHVLVGETTEMFVAAIGDQPLQYQWRRDGMPIPGATHSYERFGPFAFGDGGVYDVVITNATGAVASQATRIVVSWPDVPVAITRGLVSQSVAAGTRASFTVEATGSNLLYTWRKNGVLLPEVTGPSLVVASAADSDSATYTVGVRNNYSNEQTASADLTVTSAATNPVIVRQPASRTVRRGDTADLSVAVNGRGPLAYQWRRNGTPLADGAYIFGTRTDTLRIYNVTATDAASYDLVATNALGNATSAAATINFDSNGPGFNVQPWNVAGTLDSQIYVPANATAKAGGGLGNIRWERDGASLPAQSTGALFLPRFQPADVGLYTAIATEEAVTRSRPAIIGLTSATKVAGTGREVGPNIVHPNGNVYDQVLLDGAGATITADPGQVVRLSFVDSNLDIVQVEFSGAGALSLRLDQAAGPAEAANYVQPGVAYMKGHASIVITGADETTNVSVFSVGRITAVNSSLFRGDITYDGAADLAYIAILSSTGRFGGVRAGNARFGNSAGFVGLYAPGVEFTGPVVLGDIKAAGDATPVLQIGAANDVRVAGGDLLQPNARAVQVSGVARLQFTAGTDSHGKSLPAQSNRARFEQDGVDVTAQFVGP